jgi:6-phosphogluconolactonase
MLSKVVAMRYDTARGTLTEIQTLSTLPEGFTGDNSGAEIAVHPNGRFLYSSNRGHDSIAAFRIDDGKGTLTPLDRVPTQGKTPRNFAIDPSGRFLLAANQNSGTVVVFRIDPATGALTPAGTTVQVPFPVSVVFAKP